MKKLCLFLLGSFISCLAISQNQCEVYALKYSAIMHDSTITAHEKDSVNIDFMIWLIKGNGKYILMDAGYLYSVESAKSFDVIDDLRPDSTLQKLALKPEEVTDIILSYQHLDHINSIDMFPNAQVWVQKDDYTYFTTAAWQKGGVNSEFNRKEVKKLIEVHEKGRVTLFEGYNKEIIQGLKIFPGSRNPSLPQYALIKTSLGNMALASDNIWIYYNSDFVTPAPSFRTFDANGYIKAMQKMQTLVNDEKLIVPGYEGSAFTKFPIITEGVIRVK
ncbi:MAG: MBL fold metallo-hydrolase [Niastella sp.]|uniref:MBL fold metallo-hydrolase n=1 Tax=Niastella sp. TaxID=1869183 RepID=UPI003899F176